jgi:lipoprotein-anchoring transpeptidase ErfK/SrfK
MMRLREFAGVAAVAMLVTGAVTALQHSHVDLRQEIAKLNLRGQELLSAEAAPANPVRVASSMLPPKILPIPMTVPAPPARPSVPQQTIPEVDAAIAQADAVAERVKESVPSELFQYFDVYLYVSKAAQGEWAQHMFVYHRNGDGRLVFEETFPVSTGRERREKYFTTTPTGIFELDPDRFDANHRSHRWHNAPMPWAMFLNYAINDHPVGIALHSGIGHEDELGHRASGGCVRMPPQKAEEYFKRFQASESGEVPVMAFDDLSGTTRADGSVQRDPDNRPVLRRGYKVLLIIQNYSGGPALVAVLS